MGTTDTPASKELQRFWLEHIKRCTDQGQPMADYANAHGLKISALYYWNKRLRVLGLLPRDQRRSRFTAVQLASSGVAAGHYRLCFPDGLVLEWDDRGDGADLGTVIGVVQQHR